MAGLWHAAAQIRSNATQTTFAQAAGLFGELAGVCREVVAEAAAVAPLPQPVWSAPTTGEAVAAAVRAGRESDWAALTRCGDRWDAVHSAAALLIETGTLQSELSFAGPTSVCTQFLAWQEALDGLPQLRRLPGALRLRAAVDRGWRPGLWLLSDHRAAAARPLESQVPAKPASVAREFARRVFGWSAFAAPSRGHGGTRAVQRSTSRTNLYHHRCRVVAVAHRSHRR
jgi:hypothetical protein